jgi:hypothetical protein
MESLVGLEACCRVSYLNLYSKVSCLKTKREAVPGNPFIAMLWGVDAPLGGNYIGSVRCSNCVFLDFDRQDQGIVFHAFRPVSTEAFCQRCGYRLHQVEARLSESGDSRL